MFCFAAKVYFCILLVRNILVLFAWSCLKFQYMGQVVLKDFQRNLFANLEDEVGKVTSFKRINLDGITGWCSSGVDKIIL